MDTIHVLLLEDQEGEARLNQRLLERSFTTEFRFTSVRRLDEAMTAAAADRFDVALVDLNLPDSKGIDTFLAFRNAAPGIPIVIISAVADERLALAAIRQGAQDYLVKGSITSETLTRVVRYAVARKESEVSGGRIAVHRDPAALPRCAAFILTADGSVELLSSQLAALLDQSDPLALLQHPFARFFHVQDQERIGEAVDRVRRSERGEVIVVRSQGQDNAARRLMMTLAPATGEDGTTVVEGTLVPAPTGMVEDHDDEDLGLRYRTLVEYSQDGIFLLSDGKFLFVNHALSSMLGHTVEELLEKDFFDIVAPEDVGFVRDDLQRRVAGEVVDTSYEFTALHRNGNRVRVQLNVGRISLQGGAGVMGTVKDVSESYRAAYLMRLQHRLAVSLAQSHGRTEIFEHVLQGVLRIESIDLAAVFVHDPESGCYSREAWRGLQAPFPSADDDAAFAQAHDHLIRQGKATFLNADSIAGDPFGGKLAPAGLRCFAMVPVSHGGEQIAAIDVASLTADHFDEPVVQSLEAISTFLGGVLARVIAEEARGESEMLYRAVVEKSHDAILIYRENQILFANEKALSLTGYRKEDLPTLNPWTLVHPEDRERIQAIGTERMGGSESPKIYEGRILTKDGTIRTGEFAATLIRYGGGPAALVTVRDISTRKSQEEELRRSDALIRAAGFAATRFLRAESWEACLHDVLDRFGTAANVCRVVIFEAVADAQGSRVMRQRAVWVRSEMRDSIIEQVPDGQSFAQRPFRRWAGELSAGKAIHGIIDELPDDEQVVLARQNVRSLAMLPVFSGDRWWGLVRFDECRLRRTWLHSEIEAMRVCAETLGAAMHRKQAEQEILDSREQVLRAEAIKNAFIANISHEVRTPVNIILGYLALITELTGADSDGEIGDYSRAIDEASHRLIRTVDSILNISRFQSRDIIPQRIPIRLDKLLSSRAETFQKEIDEKGLAFEFANACGRAEILGDQHFLIDAFDHLFDNAVKFTPSGSIRLSLDGTADGGLLVCLEDTGVGISEAFLEKVFDPYLQEEMGYNRRYEGIGLGLTLVKLYLEAHGASIAIQSSKGSGTRVEIRFTSAAI
jgi:PAS domain S-box-containing protein